jgi:hypothetical protein
MMTPPTDGAKARDTAARHQAYNDRMLSLVELMRAFGGGASAFKPGNVTLHALASDLAGLVRRIARVNDTAIAVQAADDCRDREVANPEVRLILLVILETLVRTGASADKTLTVEINCVPSPAAANAVPELPEKWLNAQLHEAVKQLREEAGGEIEVRPGDQGMLARITVPLKPQ